MEKWLSIVTNVAVIAGIGFLIVEVQQTNTLLEFEARNAIGESRRELVMANMNNDALIEARIRAANGEELSPADNRRLTLFFFTMFRSWQELFYSYQAGFISKEEMASELVTWQRTIFTNDYVLYRWIGNRAELTSNFVEFVEQQHSDKIAQELLKLESDDAQVENR